MLCSIPCMICIYSMQDLPLQYASYKQQTFLGFIEWARFIFITCLVFIFNVKSYFVSINLCKHCIVAYCSPEVYKYFILPQYFVDAIYNFMEIILPQMSQPTTQFIFPTFSFRRLILLLSYTFAENCYFLRKITLLTMANS